MNRVLRLGIVKGAMWIRVIVNQRLASLGEHPKYLPTSTLRHLVHKPVFCGFIENLEMATILLVGQGTGWPRMAFDVQVAQGQFQYESFLIDGRHQKLFNTRGKNIGVCQNFFGLWLPQIAYPEQLHAANLADQAHHFLPGCFVPITDLADQMNNALTLLPQIAVGKRAHRLRVVTGADITVTCGIAFANKQKTIPSAFINPLSGKIFNVRKAVWTLQLIHVADSFSCCKDCNQRLVV
ncbi:hypothetical protein BLL52_4122 [Rhodoferax antarcticus ANT.BR]|uniref:Uncharacterized protein n=1 Tax=Rhodoferax antarcticus ANT.BR TaxID=1111071 RepID=A0A1Q8Y917_9BURK|nr:hypothetical protein BLL52_4122 [Rhodoferax antarcticus ANT.BR]